VFDKEPGRQISEKRFSAAGPAPLVTPSMECGDGVTGLREGCGRMISRVSLRLSRFIVGRAGDYSAIEPSKFDACL
jgi:hypothetical protein